jgi:hypothetical protein
MALTLEPTNLQHALRMSNLWAQSLDRVNYYHYGDYPKDFPQMRADTEQAVSSQAADILAGTDSNLLSSPTIKSAYDAVSAVQRSTAAADLPTAIKDVATAQQVLREAVDVVTPKPVDQGPNQWTIGEGRPVYL